MWNLYFFQRCCQKKMPCFCYCFTPSELKVPADKETKFAGVFSLSPHSKQEILRHLQLSFLCHSCIPPHQPSIYLFAIGRPSSQIAFRTFWLNLPCLLLCSRPSAAWLSIFPTVPRRAAATAGWETPSPAARLAPANLFPSASPRRSTTNKHPPTAAPREMETQTPNPVSFSFSFFSFFWQQANVVICIFLGNLVDFVADFPEYRKGGGHLWAFSDSRSH